MSPFQLIGYSHEDAESEGDALCRKNCNVECAAFNLKHE